MSQKILFKDCYILLHLPYKQKDYYRGLPFQEGGGGLMAFDTVIVMIHDPIDIDSHDLRAFLGEWVRSEKTIIVKDKISKINTNTLKIL